MSVHSAKDFFRIVSLLEGHLGKGNSYLAKIISFEQGNVNSASGSAIVPDELLNETDIFDLIIIPPIEGPQLTNNFQPFEKITNWLTQQIKNKTPMLALTTGSHLLAATGLADNVLMATHWAFVRKLQKIHPQCQFTASNSYMQTDNIYTTGSLNASYEVLLAMIAQDNGDQFAQLCATHILLEDPKELIPTLVGYRNHKDSAIFDIQDHIEKHYAKQFSVTEIAKKFGFSERNIKRRFKQATDTSLIQYLQLVRIDKAKKLLITSNLSIKEISYEVGYESDNFFTRIFKKELNMTPSQWRKNTNSLV